MTGTPRIPRSASGQLAPNAQTAPSVDGQGTAAKATLRKTLAGIRNNIDPDHKAEWDARICARVLDWCEASGIAGPLGVYWPLRGETELGPAYATLAQRGVTLALPVVVARDAPLGFAEWVPGEQMVIGAMGVAVPARLRMLERPAALLVPCLGLNAPGYRLGYGGGFYDRTLAPPPRPLTAGVAYACQESQFGHDAHDIALDVILTERQ